MSQTLSTEQRVVLARAYVKVVFNGHQPDRASDYTDDVVWHGNSRGEVIGLENLTALLGALPDLVAEEQDVIASDDLVGVRVIVTATHQGDLIGIPATGRRVQWNAVDMLDMIARGVAPAFGWKPESASEGAPPNLR